MALLGMDAAPVTAAIDECIGLLLDDPVRVIRIHGLPGVPLTLPRIVEELGADQREGQPTDDDELIVRVLARRSNHENQVALIIEQAELLPLPTLAFLQVALTVFGARTPRLQLIFAGHPRFEQLLVRGELAGLRNRLEAVIRVARLSVSAAPAAPVRVVPDGAASRRRSVPGFGPGAKILTALLALMLVIAAATLVITRRGAVQQANQVKNATLLDAARADPPSIGTPTLPLPRPQDMPAPVSPPPTALSEPSRPQDATPPSTQEAIPAPAAPRAERGTVPSGDQLAQLRGEFDRFLAQTEWGSKRLGEGERARLFNEYLRWNYGAAGANPGPPP